MARSASVTKRPPMKGGQFYVGSPDALEDASYRQSTIEAAIRAAKLRIDESGYGGDIAFPVVQVVAIVRRKHIDPPVETVRLKR